MQCTAAVTDQRAPAFALQFIWFMFALTWDLAFTGLITIKAEECLYMMCDFGAKVGV
jgi:hypothetical protein